MNEREYIRASEIQDYTFCKRGWWLKLHGRLPETEQMRAGIIAHEHLAQTVKGVGRWKRFALVFIIIAIALLLLSLAFLLIF